MKVKVEMNKKLNKSSNNIKRLKFYFAVCNKMQPVEIYKETMNYKILKYPITNIKYV